MVHRLQNNCMIRKDLTTFFQRPHTEKPTLCPQGTTEHLLVLAGLPGCLLPFKLTFFPLELAHLLLKLVLTGDEVSLSLRQLLPATDSAAI